MSAGERRYDAVVFDLGGVVLPSPFDAWAAYETELGLPVGFIRGVVHRSGDDGAWSRHERGEIGFDDFCRLFGEECAREPGGERVSAAEVMARLAAGVEPRPEMLSAIRRLRESGFATAALTNNWRAEGGEAEGRGDGEGTVAALGPLFDVIVESAVEGLRKPDPAIYLLTCSRLGVSPDRAVFLDDLGVNLKPARELGMATVKVVDPARALAELGRLVGMALP